MTSRKVATARRCRVGPACAYPAIRGGWPTALVSKAGSRSKRDKAIEQCRTDLTTRSLLIPPRLEAPPAAGLFIYRKVGTLVAYSSTRNRSISIPLVGHLARFPRGRP